MGECFQALLGGGFPNVKTILKLYGPSCGTEEKAGIDPT